MAHGLSTGQSGFSLLSTVEASSLTHVASALAVGDQSSGLLDLTPTAQTWGCLGPHSLSCPHYQNAVVPQP